MKTYTIVFEENWGEYEGRMSVTCETFQMCGPQSFQADTVTITLDEDILSVTNPAGELVYKIHHPIQKGQLL